MDIALRYDADAGTYDVALDADEGLETAVLLSLYTDRRAQAADALPDDAGDRRGWWCDAFADRALGSRLWLLSREKETASVLRRAEEYAREALAWITADGVASALDVQAIHLRRGVLQLIVAIERGDGSGVERRYDYAWGESRGI